MLLLIILLLILALPLLTGLALARLRPAMSSFQAALVACLPMLAVFVGVVFLLAQAAREQGPSPYAVPALVVFGITAGLCGFGLGFFGHTLGRRR